MREFNLKVVTPERVAYSGKATGVSLVTVDGHVEILAGHVDYFCALSVGSGKITLTDGVRYMTHNGGFVSVSGGDVSVVTTTLEYKDEIDVRRAEAARERAEAAIRAARDENEHKLARARLMRAIARINTAGMK